MGRHCSDELRERAATAIFCDRICREVAALISLRVARTVKWSKRLLQAGNAGAMARERHLPPRRNLIFEQFEPTKALTTRDLTK